jgi:cation/acetate symporter
VLQFPPVALLLAAEIKIAALIAAMFLPLSYTLAVAAVVIMIASITIVGGMRSLTWSASAQFIVSVLGFAVPLIIVAVLLTNLPAPQLTYGEMFEPLQRSETIAGVAPAAPGELEAALPAEQPRPSVTISASLRRHQPDSFLTLFLCLTLGCGAAEPARTEWRHELSRRSAALGCRGAFFYVALFAIRAGVRPPSSST